MGPICSRLARAAAIGALVLLAACSSDAARAPANEVGAAEAEIVAPASLVPEGPVVTGAVRQPVTGVQAVGDSILGWNQESGEAISDVLGAELGVPSVNNAVGGATLTGSDGIPTLYEPDDASHVLITGGGNDFAVSCSEDMLDRLVSADLTSGRMVDLVDRVAANGSQAVIMGYYLPVRSGGECALFDDLATRYRSLAEAREDVVFVRSDLTVTPAAPELYADEVHPSPRGGIVLGRFLADVFGR
ncbi:MAG: SGNH/GDSL hydrolase family protein [Actinomycetota bacterium]